jgi:hemerythrin-like metal-binding protein
MPQFDAHHQHLVALVNELYRCSLTDHDSQALQTIITQLTSYTEYHFSAEEELMERAGFPGLEQHRTEHRQFTGMVHACQQELYAGHDMVIDLLSFLGNWLFDHILESDAAYSEQLSALTPP